MASQDWTPIGRCCREHLDYRTLTEHLLREFGELPEVDVARQVMWAREAVEAFGFSQPDDMETAELICRYQLSYLAGRFEDVARLNPQVHPRRLPRIDDALAG